MMSLGWRLAFWARSRGWELIYSAGRDALTGKPFVAATIGPHEGRGRTAHEALNDLAAALVEEGWQDDRKQVAA